LTSLSSATISPGARIWRARYALAYLGFFTAFTLQVARFGDRHTGYTSLIYFGEHFAQRRVPELAELPVYTYAQQDGYDGQFYAQIAVAGNPFDPDLIRALDSPGYREGRILLPLIVHFVGLGRPAVIVQVYALANLACLAVLAALLALWWFPPTDLDHLLRWAGTVFGAGMVVSVTRSLPDGPALLLMVVGIRQLERGRIWGASVALALAGLARETGVLAASAFWPRGPTAPPWRRALLAGVLCVGPAALWIVVLHVHQQRVGGLRNIGLPFAGILFKARELAADYRARSFDAALRGELLITVGLAVQIGFLAARRRPDEPLWRIGAAFAVFSALLDRPVWEGFPSAVARVMLPLTLAFNRLAPHTRRGLALLALGNLGLLAVPDLFDSGPPTEQLAFAGGVEARYGAGWLAPEHAGRETWRWASGPATLTLENPNRDARPIALDFTLRSRTSRTVTVALGSGTGTRSFFLAPDRQLPVHLAPVVIQPGRTNVIFSTSEPAWTDPRSAGRPLAFALSGFYATVGPPAGQ
jgi:hypothetical protein